MTAPERPTGFVVAYHVEVVFDTPASGTGYDFDRIVARCAVCGEQLDDIGSIISHARSHEPA